MYLACISFSSLVMIQHTVGDRPRKCTCFHFDTVFLGETGNGDEGGGRR